MGISALKFIFYSRWLPRRLQYRFVASLPSDGKVLDIGAGSGKYGRLFKDYTPTDVEARNPASVIADANVALPFPSGSFDLVMAIEVLEHLHTPTVTVREAFRVLKQGGTFAATVPFVWKLHEEPHDFHRYTKYAVEKYLKDVGFIEIAIEPECGYVYTLMALTAAKWRFLAPLTNTTGYLASLFEKDFSLPLGNRVRAKKPK